MNLQKNRQKRPRINVVDFVVVLLILVAAGVAFWQLFGDRVSDSVATKVKITYTVRTEETTPEYYSSFAGQGFPQQLVAEKRLVAGAFMTAAEPVPHVSNVATVEGAIDPVEEQDRIDVLCTIEATVSDGPIITVGDQDIRVGRKYLIRTPYFEMYGFIETVEFER